MNYVSEIEFQKPNSSYLYSCVDIWIYLHSHTVHISRSLEKYIKRNLDYSKFLKEIHFVRPCTV